MSVSRPTDRPARRGSTVLATRPLTSWRTIDLITCAVLGVAFGIAYWGWDLAYQAPANGLAAIFPPLQGLTSSVWLIGGVVGGLVIRRPGAALFTEMVAATVEGLVGSQWGISTLLSGFLQGIGAEIGFAILGYAAFGLLAAALAGALAAPLEALYEWYAYWGSWDMGYKLAYLVFFMIGGAVVTGGIAWLLTRALGRSGALAAFPPGHEAREAGAG